MKNANRTTRRRTRRPGFVLLRALTLFAVVAGLGTVLALNAGYLFTADRTRTINMQLRQMIDSGATYARLHCADLPTDGVPVVIDAADLTDPNRTAHITLEPTFGAGGQVEGVVRTGEGRVFDTVDEEPRLRDPQVRTLSHN